MKITFTASGGFAGGIRRCRVDAAALGVRARACLAPAWDLSPRGRRAAGARDLLQYRIVLRRGVRRRTIVFDELSCPPGVRGLVSALMKRARSTAPLK